MLDLARIRKEPEVVAAILKKREYEVDFTEILALDEKRRELIQGAETLKNKRNKLSAEVPKMKKQGLDTTALFDEVRQIGEQIKRDDAIIAELDTKVQDFVASLPNLTDEDIVAGGKENNAVEHIFGEKPAFDFQPLSHIDLCEKLGLVDYVRGAKLGGSGFWVYTRDGALLEWALLQYFVQTHLNDGYEFMLVPHMLLDECGYTAGQFPKFREDVYSIGGFEGRHFLLPTAETALVNLHRDEILAEADLPRKYFSYTPCYRREAGSYRSEERGMIRGHQFNKVEMVQYTRPEDSAEAFKEMVGKAEALMQGLGLHYQLSKLAAGDVSASMARTYDVEVWIPSMGIYKEVCSASNANDYQARRGSMRFRREETKKTEFVHTLNASGLATSRLFPALLEQFQNADGSVTIPEVLRPYMGGREKLLPKG